MNQTIEYYNQNAEEYFNSTVDADMSVCREKFMIYLPKSGLILDVGCGSGRDSKAFLGKGYRVEAIDGSKKICMLASAYIGQAVKNISFEDIVYENEFDGVWACASLLHIAKKELPYLVKKLGRALKDLGILYVSFKFGNEERIVGNRIFSDFTEKTAMQLLEDAGFRILECFKSCDVRTGRRNECWVNIYGQKNENK